MYADFNEWGKTSEIRCSVILDLRRRGSNVQDPLRRGFGRRRQPSEGIGADERVKKGWLLTLEEYNAALDADITFNVDRDLALDLSESPAKT